MPSRVAGGFLRTDAGSLIATGLTTGDFVPLEADTSLSSSTELFRRGLPA